MYKVLILTFSIYLSTLIVGGIYVPWLKTLVIVRLMVRTKNDSVVSVDLGQSELRVQHLQQNKDLTQ